MKASAVKQVTKVNWSVVGSTALGVALFGAVVYGVSRLPTNSVTRPVKQTVAAVK